MNIDSLCYVGLQARDPAEWGGFAEKVLGARASTGADGACRVAFDGRPFRLAVLPGEAGRLSYMGWELASAEAYEAALARLDAQGIAYRRAGAGECADRQVAALAVLADPAGNRVELCLGAARGAAPFRPATDISGFVGLGHAFLGVAPETLPAMEAFYVGVLGLKVSDYADFEREGIAYSALFLRAGDGKHHSLAIGTFPKPLHHLLIEVKEIDDLGRTLDLCAANGVRITRQLGRHSNDLMLSFYLESPNGVLIEYGFGGRRVEDATWQIVRMDSVSLWGHRATA